MLSKVAMLVAVFLLLGTTAAFAVPPANIEGDDMPTLVLSQTAPELFLSATMDESAFVVSDSRDDVFDY